MEAAAEIARSMLAARERFVIETALGPASFDLGGSSVLAETLDRCGIPAS